VFCVVSFPTFAFYTRPLIAHFVGFNFVFDAGVLNIVTNKCKTHVMIPISPKTLLGTTTSFVGNLICFPAVKEF